ncbi:MAG: hypothetical protein M0Q26_14940 [Chitinophagaceae bacterium]|nr:hypothetical protein [Chitinophagaceae bacterium]
MYNKIPKSVDVIVAHPDDETLSTEGKTLSHHLQFDINSLKYKGLTANQAKEKLLTEGFNTKPVGNRNAWLSDSSMYRQNRHAYPK